MENVVLSRTRKNVNVTGRCTYYIIKLYIYMVSCSVLTVPPPPWYGGVGPPVRYTHCISTLYIVCAIYSIYTIYTTRNHLQHSSWGNLYTLYTIYTIYIYIYMSQASLVPPSPPLQGICGLWWGHTCVHT